MANVVEEVAARGSYKQRDLTWTNSQVNLHRQAAVDLAEASGDIEK